MKRQKFNVARLVKDMGGASAVANLLGTPRTAPYRWIRHRYVSSRMLEALKWHHPDLKIDEYFEDYDNDDNDDNEHNPNLH